MSTTTIEQFEPATDERRAADGLSPAARYSRVRAITEKLCEPLAAEDYVVQSMPDVSPTKWHLAHTSWFFETFILTEHDSAYEPLNPAYAYLFNSYYVQAGERHCRDQRGYLSRPTVAEVYEYREHVDIHMLKLLESSGNGNPSELLPVLEVGLNHEQQHQELMLMDIKHVFSVNPLRPVYREERGSPAADPGELCWFDYPEGVHHVGHEGTAFSYDNETPRHREFLEPFRLASRPVTNGEYLRFMEDGGYERAELWLSEGWATAREKEWTEPFYWEKRDGRWLMFTLAGMREVDPHEPACHLTYFEADAYARWAGARLPTEAEWEVAAAKVPRTGNFVEDGQYHPRPANDPAAAAPGQMFGDVWEWTRSQYSPYPGYRPLPGALGEYNGKFMCNQFVLRGGSCATSRTHIRPTYRNFFPPAAAWQFSGFRLARDV